MSQRLAIVRRYRMAIGTAVVIALAAASVLVYALTTRGNPSREAHLNDAGVWVSTDPVSGSGGTSALFGQVNASARHLASVIYPTKSDTASVDVLQDGNAAFGYDTQAGSLTPLDPVTQVALKDAAVSLGKARAVIGGGERSGTLAAFDPDGDLWATTFFADAPVDDLSALDPQQSKPIAKVGANADVAVGTDGTVYAASLSTGVTRAARGSDGAWATAVTPLPSGLTGTVSITVVGSTPVVLVTSQGSARPELILPGVRPQELDDATGAVLQQPGTNASSVLIATSSALVKVSLSSGERTTLANGGAGAPARPVLFQQCAYGAWGGSHLVTALNCDGNPQHTRLHNDIASMKPGLAFNSLVFRANHESLLLNDLDTGQVVDHLGSDPQQIADWQAAKVPTQNNNNSGDQNDGADKDKAPIAKPDDYGARPGRVTTLHVLDNDRTPAGTVLTVARVIDPSGLATIAPDGQSVSFAMPATGSSGPYSFQYDVSNGVKTSQPAQVTVRAVSPDEYFAPRPRIGSRIQTFAVPVNGVVTIPVLSDWRDDETGDPPALSALTAQSVKAPGASAVATPDGSIVYSAGSSPVTDTITYTVIDGDKVSAPATLTINVQGLKDRASAATARDDYVHLVRGQPLLVYPLANDLPGSDPLDPAASLQIAGTIKSQPGLTVSPPDASGGVVLTATQNLNTVLKYQAGYGSAPVSNPASIRVDVTDPDLHATVAGGPDTVTVRGTVPALLDPLVNDASPSGGLLTVVGVDLPNHANLQVSVVRGRWLRVNEIEPVSEQAAMTTESFTYAVTDGSSAPVNVAVTVVELPRMANDVPVAETDYATVRAGDSTLVPVLDNDVDPAGDTLTLAPMDGGGLGGSAPAGQLPVIGDTAGGQASGAAYLAGDEVRYVAPAMATPAAGASTAGRQVRVTYTVVNSDGQPGTGTIVVTIVPPVADAKDDQAPVPPDLEARVVAGGTVTIHVPTSGVDPDGDSVQVQGLALPQDGDPQPKLGAVTAYTANSLTYQAYPSDTNAGTDMFVYQVTDTYGVTARATVRVAVVQPTALAAPVPHTVTLTATPGTQVLLHVISPTFVDYPEGAAPKLLLDPNTRDAELDAKHDGWLIVHVPQGATGQSVTVQYQVQGDLGEPQSGAIVLQLDKDYRMPPVVVDEFAPMPKAGATNVSVNLLAGDYSPTGGSLSIVAQRGVDAKGRLTVTLSDRPQAIPFVVKDENGATAAAVAYIPAIGADAVPMWNGKPIQVKSSPTVVDIADYVKDPEGKALQLTDRSKQWTSPNPGLSAKITAVTTLQLTGAAGYQGPGSLTFAVTRTGDLNKYSLITIPVMVGDPLPVLRCPPGVISIQQGDKAGVPLSPLSWCHVWTPPSVNPASLTFDLSWQKDPDAGHVTFPSNGAAQDTIFADHNSHPGNTGVLIVKIHQYAKSLPATMRVVLTPAPALSMSPISVQGILATATKPTVIDLTKYADTPFDKSGLSIVKVGSIPNVTVTKSADERSLSIRATKRDLNGPATLSYTVTDVDRATTDARRLHSGNISLQFIGVPDAPTAVTPRPGFESQQVPVSWTPPADNGARITGYEVSYTSTDAPSGTQQCPARSSCTITGLHNGADYRFTVKAKNLAGWGAVSGQSGAGTPDIKPGAVQGFTTPARPGDKTITLTWTPLHDAAGETGWQYRVWWEGGPGAGSVVLPSRDDHDRTVGSLDNDSVYTFHIQASNRAGAGPDVTLKAQPAGKPAAPSFAADTFTPTKTATGKVAAVIKWTAVTDPNGPGFGSTQAVKYTLARYLGGADPVTVCADTLDLQCTDQLSTGKTYSYRVTASNQFNTGPASAVAQVEASSTPEQMAQPTVSPVKAADPDYTVTLNFTTAASNGSSLTVHCAYTTSGANPTQDSAACPGSPWTGYSPDGGSADSKALRLASSGSALAPRFILWEDNGSTVNTKFKTGPASDVSAGGVSTNAPPQQPANTSCSLYGTNVVYNWDAVDGSNGRTVQYELTGDVTTTSPTSGTSATYNYDKSDYLSHAATVRAVDSFGDQSPPVTITCPDKKPPAPPNVSSLSCSRSGTTITWSWTKPSPPNGNISYRIALSGATTSSDYGSSSWSHDWGQDGAGHSLTVTVIDNGGQSSSGASASCDEPAPAPSVTVAKGPNEVATVGSPACTTSPGCPTLAVTVHNFPTGSYYWSCTENGSIFLNSSTYGWKLTVTQANQTFSGSQRYCEDANTGVTVGIIIHGVNGQDVSGSTAF